MDICVLLEKIKNINIKYENDLKQTGENFNIFNILGFSKDELSHSKILNEFLDPNGSHNKGDIFLKLFLEELKIEDFNTENATTRIEKFIGFITENYEEGGRIDIVIIRNQNQQIFIENKIDADDQKKQLLRYHNHNKEAKIIYLTKDGRDASEKSTGGKDFHYYKVSYRHHIIKWLEKCIEKSEDNPIVKETIKQYIVLINQLTGQTRSNEMATEYFESISRDYKYVTAAFDIYDNFMDLKKYIIDIHFIPKLSLMIKNYYLIPDENMAAETMLGPRSDPGSFFILNPKWKYIKIGFEFENNDFTDLTYGIKWINDDNKSTELSEYFNKNAKKLGFDSILIWPLTKKMNRYKNWDKYFFSEIVTDNNEIIPFFGEIIEELISAVKGYKGEL